MKFARRIAKIEKLLADFADQEKLANCNCLPPTHSTVVFSDNTEEFKAQMNIPCPAHGFRRMGMIVTVEHMAQKGHGSATGMLRTYRARELTWNREQLSKLRLALKRKT